MSKINFEILVHHRRKDFHKLAFCSVWEPAFKKSVSQKIQILFIKQYEIESEIQTAHQLLPPSQH